MFSVSNLCKFLKVTFSANLRCVHNAHLQNFHFRKISLQRLVTAMQNVSSNCHTSIPYFQKAKTFPDVENQKIHSSMENMPGYNDVVKRPTMDMLRNTTVEDCWNSSLELPPSEVCLKFVRVTLENTKEKLRLEDSCFQDLVIEVVRHLPDATDDHLIKLLTSLCLWPPSPKASEPIFKMLWNSLDNKCCVRLKHWEPSYKLYVADLWFHLRLSRITKYNSLMIEDLVRNKYLLSVPQLVQLMFYVNLQRDTPQSLLKSLEDKLEQAIKDINLQELCIICLGFFKTKNRVTSKHFVKSVLLRLILEVPKADSVSFGGCLKFLRRSLHGNLKDLYISLLHQSVKHIHKFDVPVLIQLALLSAGINMHMPLLLDSIMDKLVEEKSSMRAKDGMKLLQCLAQFRHEPKSDFNELFQKVFVDKEYESEIMSYPRILFYALLSYAYLGQYPLNLINKALQPEFVQSCIDLNGVEMMSPIAVLNYCIEIECENYHGPKVDQSILKILQIEKGNIPQNRGRESIQARLINLTFKVLSDMCDNGDDICVKHVLPHMYSPEIIFRVNSRDQEPLSTVIEKMSGNCIIRPPPHELWVCVMVCGIFCFSERSKRLSGLAAMKRRQLVKLGYKVLQVPYYEAENVPHLTKYLKKQLELLKMNNPDINFKSLIL